MPGPVGPVAFALACLIGLVPIARRAFAALRLGQPFTIEGLMTVAAAGALFIGAAEEAALVIFLFAVGEVLEGVAASRARDGIRALSRLVPETARLEQDGRTLEVPAAGLQPGQIVRVRPGERIPADGEILEGQGGLDESPVTGESIPVTRAPARRSSRVRSRPMRPCASASRARRRTTRSRASSAWSRRPRKRVPRPSGSSTGSAAGTCR